MKKNAVRIDMTVSGKIRVWILDPEYVYGSGFFSDDFKSLRGVRRFLTKHKWIPKYFFPGPHHGSVDAKKFRLKYPKRGESATTYFEANVVTIVKMSPSSCVVPIERAGSKFWG